MLRAFVVAILYTATLSAAQRLITENEASELVHALLKPDGWTKLRGFVLYQALFEGQFQDFYFIHADRDNPSGKGSSIGHYAVDRATGDVWDWVTCGRYSSPSLTAAQQALRKRIGLTDAEYQQIKKLGPFCSPDENPHALKIGRPPKQ